MAGTGGKRRSHGEGTIYHRKDGRWEAAISLGDGTRKRHCARTQGEARRWLTKMQRERDQGLPVIRDERQTIAQYLPVWLDIVRPSLKPRSYEAYECACRVHLIPAVGRLSLGKLTPQDVQHFTAAKLASGLSRARVGFLVGCLHRALSDAQRLGLVATNAASRVPLPRPTRRPMAVYTRDEAARYLAAAHGHRLEALFVLMLTTGMREGELFGLRWRDLDLDATPPALSVQLGMQKVYSRSERGGAFVHDEPKTSGSRRRVLLTPLAVAQLRAHRKRQIAERLAAPPAAAVWNARDLVFVTERGTPFDRSHFRKRHHLPLVAPAGLPYIRPHDLRHTAATLLLSQGVPVKVVSEMLGHTDITITLRVYAHVLPTMQADATAVMGALFAELPAGLPQDSTPAASE